MACIDTTGINAILKIDLGKKQAKPANIDTSRKPYKFDTHKITPAIIYNVFTGKNDENGNTPWKVLVDTVKNSSAIKKLFGVQKLYEFNNPLFDDLKDAKDDVEAKKNGRRMQIRGIAMKHILSSIKSEADIQNNIGLSPDDAHALISNGSRKISMLNAATAAGRDIAYAMGFKVSADPATANRFYYEIGKKAIQEIADETNILTIETNDYILNNDFRKDRFTKYAPGKKLIKGFDTVRINYDALGIKYEVYIDAFNKALENGSDLSGIDREYSWSDNPLSVIQSAAKYIETMSVPSNLVAPSLKNDESNEPLEKDIHMSQENKELLMKLQNGSMQINPRVGKFFLSLYRIMEEAKKDASRNDVDYDFMSVIKYTFGSNNDFLHFVFGTYDSTATIDTKGKAVGQALSKTSTIQAFVENAPRYFNEDGTPKDMFLRHEMYRTGRVGFFNTIFNPQTDKFFSRYIIDGGIYVIKKGTKEFIQMVNSLMDDSGLSYNEIVNDGVNEGLDTLLELYENIYKSGKSQDDVFKEEENLFKIMMNGFVYKDGKRIALPNIKGSLWAKMASIEAIYDIRNASNDGKIKTRYMSKPDATGSGIVLQLLQMSGYESAAKSIEKLEELGIIGDNPDIDDVYGFMQKAIKQRQESIMNEDEMIANDFINKMISLGFVKNMRDIVKPPTMITSYLAGKNTVIDTIGKEYTNAIYDVLENNKASKQQKDFVLELLRTYDEKYNRRGESILKRMPKNPNGREIANTPGVKMALEYMISDTAGNYMYDLVSESLTKGAMNKFQKMVIDLYKDMEKISKQHQKITGEPLQLKVLPAQIVMDMQMFPDSKSWLNDDGTKMTKAQLIEKYGMPITSASQTIVDTKNGKSLVLMESSNQLSSLVNVIHSMDSAIMFLAHRKTLEYIEEQLKPENAKKLTLGRRAQLNHALKSVKASIHDANNASAVYNSIFQDMYRESIGEVFAGYDMYSEMVDAYKAMLETAHPDVQPAISTSDMQKIEEEAKNSKLKKQQMLKDGVLNLNSERTFGFKNEIDINEDEVAESAKADSANVENNREEKTTDFENPFDTTGNISKKSEKAKLSEKNREVKPNEVANVIKNEKARYVIAKFGEVVEALRNKYGLKNNEILGMNENKATSNPAYDPLNHVVKISHMLSEDISVEDAVAHEITHYLTHAYITLDSTKKDSSYKYLNGVLDFMNRKYDSIDKILQKSNKVAAKRFNRILAESNRDMQMSEMIAIFVGEPETATAIIKAIAEVGSIGNPSFNKKSYAQKVRFAINRLWNGVKKKFGISEEDIKNASLGVVEPNALIEALQSIIDAGSEYSKNYDEAKKQASKSGSKKIGLTQTISPEMSELNKKLNYKPYEPIENSDPLGPLVEFIPRINTFAAHSAVNLYMHSKPFIGASLDIADEYMYNNMPIYANLRGRIINAWDSNDFIAAMKGFLAPERTGDRMTMQKLMTLHEKVTQERGTIDNTLISNMNKLMEDYTDEQIADIYETVAMTPLFHLMDESGLYGRLISGEISVNDAISDFESKLSKSDIKRVKRMAHMLIGDENYIAEPSDSYNIDIAGFGEQTKENASKLLALYTLQLSGKYESAFGLLRENNALTELIYDASKHLKELNSIIFDSTGDTRRYRDNLIVDQFKEEYDIEAVTLDEWKEQREYNSEYGWELLRKPTKDEYGIVYRKSKDETYQSGVGTATGYKNTDVIIPKSKEKTGMKNYIKTDIGTNHPRQKLVLTMKEKEKLGLIKNPADALYRAYSRLQEIHDTQVARDLLLTDEYTQKFITKPQLEAFDAELANMAPEEMKWMLKLPEGIDFSDINDFEIVNKKKVYKYPNIRKYYKSPERVTSVKGFRHNFDLVRKDVEPWLFGYKDIVLFENSPKARKVAYVVRQMVKLTKIAWTALSPKKILNDMISNVAILIGYDVSPIKIAKYGKKAWNQIGDFERLRVKLLDAKVHNREKDIARLEKEIENHPMAIMLNNGMMQSINIELFNRDQSVVTGIQKDIEDLLNKYVLLPNGKKSAIFTAIKAFNEYTDFGLDSILEFMSKGAKEVAIVEKLGIELEKSADKIKGLRKSEREEYMAKYISEYLMTPSSEAVQFGSFLVQRADIVARSILVWDMLDKGATEEEAFMTAIDAFIDYKQNMPKELKALSDYGILLFPSFWMRVQRVILSLISRNPATATAAAAMEEVVSINIPTIFDANLFSKIDNGIFNEPPVFGWFTD